MTSIAVDWGSTSFRAYLLDEQMQLLDKTSNSYGVFKLNGSFEEVLSDSCAEWFSAHQIERIVIAGMAGSRNGWLEASYAQCPVKVEGLLGRSVEPESGLSYPIHILPGVQGISPSGFVDVMRGEEIQLMGVIDNDAALICLPGTHSKWVAVENAAIQSFATLLTGEMFELVQKNSSIGSLITDQDRKEIDKTSFENGVNDYRNANKEIDTSLLHSLFSVRAKAVTDQLEQVSMFSYLSGMIIADDINAALKMFADTQRVLLVTDEKLRAPYEQAFSLFGVDVSFIDSEQAFLQGMKKIMSASK